MRFATFSRSIRAAASGGLALGLLLSLPGCVLDKDKEPPLIGPSETGISVQMIALPDVVNADGVSESVIDG